MKRLILALLVFSTAPCSAAIIDVVVKGSTDRSVTIYIMDSTDGTPETAVEHNTAGIDLWYRREGAAVSSLTEAALAALTTAHTDGGIEHISHGAYRLDLPDAAFAAGAEHVEVGGTVTGMIVVGGTVRLVDLNIEDSTPTVDVTQIGGVAQSATDLKDFADAGYDPATDKVQGVVLVDTTTTVTNGVTLAAGAVTDASLAGGLETVFETDFATNYNATRNAWATNVQDFVGTTASDPFNGQVVAASVTGAVGSVTGAVGSVTGAVGSVTGNVGGNVVGSVGSISGITFPTNFADLAITVTTGKVTVGTNDDKIGYLISGTKTTLDSLNDVSTAQVNTEVDTALADVRLDELLAADSDIDGLTPPTDGSVFQELMSKTAIGFTWVQSTDSLEAIRDRGDGSWTTANVSSLATQASVDTIDGIVDAILVDTGTTLETHLTDVKGATFSGATDSLEAIRDRGDAAWITANISSLATQASVDTIDANVDEILVDTSAYDTDAEYATAVWNAATVTYGTAGSYGLLVETNLDATVSSRSTLSASDNIGINWADVSNPTSSVTLSGTTVGTATAVTTVNGLAANVITATSINASAITSAKFGSGAITSTVIAADAIGASQLATSCIGSLELATDCIGAAEIAAGAIVAGTEATGFATPTNITAGTITTVGTVNALAAGAVDSIWDEVVTGHATADTFGKVFDDQIDGLRAYGDGAWATAVGFSTHSAADVWTSGTRALTDKAGFTISGTKTTLDSLNDVSTAQVNTEVDTALADVRLDELLAADSDIDGLAPPTDGSVFQELMTSTAIGFTWSQATDSLEAIRDRGDAAWVTANVASLATQASVDTIDGIVDAILLDTGTDGVLLAATATSAQLVDDVWDEDVDTTHQTAGSAGKKLDDAGGAADPWSTALPGAYGVGTAGYILGTNLDAVLTARTLAAASYFDPAADTVANVTLVATTTTNTDMVSEPPTAAAISDAVWDEDIVAAHNTVNTAGALLDSPADWATATGFSTHTAADVRTEMDANSTQLAAIVADTNELQTDDYPTTLTTIAGYIDTEVADILTDTGTTLPATLAGLSTFDETTDKVFLGNGAHGGAAAAITLADYSDFQGEASGLTAASIWDYNVSAITGAGYAGNYLNNLTSGTVTVTGPVLSTNDLSLVRGDVYNTTLGNALEWSSDSWTNLTGATIVFSLRQRSNKAVVMSSIAGSVVTAGDGSQTVRVQLSAANWANVTGRETAHEYDVVATVGGLSVTLVRANCTVTDDVTK